MRFLLILAGGAAALSLTAAVIGIIHHYQRAAVVCPYELSSDGAARNWQPEWHYDALFYGPELVTRCIGPEPR